MKIKKILNDNLYQLKKVKWKNRYGEHEDVGMIIEELGWLNQIHYKLILLNGDSKEIKPDSLKDLTFSSVRVDKEIREYFNKSAKTLKKVFKDRVDTAIRAKEAEDAQNNAYREFEKELIEVTGIINLDKLLNIISSKLWDNIDRIGFNDILKSTSHGDEVSIGITIGYQIRKYVTPDMYPFLYAEYDGQLFVEDRFANESLLLKQLDQKHTVNVQPIKQMKDVKAVNVTPGFDVGDKNTLYFNKNIEVTFKKGTKMTKALADELAVAFVKSM